MGVDSREFRVPSNLLIMIRVIWSYIAVFLSLYIINFDPIQSSMSFVVQCCSQLVDTMVSSSFSFYFMTRTSDRLLISVPQTFHRRLHGPMPSRPLLPRRVDLSQPVSLSHGAVRRGGGSRYGCVFGSLSTPNGVPPWVRGIPFQYYYRICYFAFVSPSTMPRASYFILLF